LKTFERVLFLLAFLFIDIYTTRHIYRLWLAPTTSVLDEFKGKAEIAVDSATDLRQLLAKYRPAREAVRKLERQNAGKPELEWRLADQEPFLTEATLRRAIEAREARQAHRSQSLRQRERCRVAVALWSSGSFMSSRA